MLPESKILININMLQGELMTFNCDSCKKPFDYNKTKPKMVPC